MSRGRDGEIILEDLISMLASKNNEIRKDGMKVWELLLKNRQNYTIDFKNKATKMLQTSFMQSEWHLD